MFRGVCLMFSLFWQYNFFSLQIFYFKYLIRNYAIKQAAFYSTKKKETEKLLTYVGVGHLMRVFFLHWIFNLENFFRFKLFNSKKKMTYSISRGVNCNSILICASRESIYFSPLFCSFAQKQILLISLTL